MPHFLMHKILAFLILRKRKNEKKRVLKLYTSIFLVDCLAKENEKKKKKRKT